MGWKRVAERGNRDVRHGDSLDEGSSTSEEVVDVDDLVHTVSEPETGLVTPEVVETLSQDPELAEVAKIAKELAPAE